MVTKVSFIFAVIGTVFAPCKIHAFNRQPWLTQVAIPVAMEHMNGSTKLDNPARVLEVSTSGPFNLTKPSVRIALRPAGKQSGGLSSEIDKLKSNQRMYLVLRGVHAASQPGTLYHLYIDMPEDSLLKHDVIRHVGVLNFFGSVPRAQSGKRVSGGLAQRSFDISELLRTLNSKKWLTDPTTLTLVRYQEVQAHSEPSVDSVEIIVE
jgi:hypothetical protein